MEAIVPNNAQLEIIFQTARDGPSVFDAISQQERRNIMAALERNAVSFAYPKRTMAFDSGDRLLEIIIAEAAGVLVYLRPIFVEWVKARGGQKIRVKVGRIEVEAATEAQVARLLEQAKALLTKDDEEGD